MRFSITFGWDMFLHLVRSLVGFNYKVSLHQTAMDCQSHRQPFMAFAKQKPWPSLVS